MDQYDKPKFEAAFQLTTAVANQIIRIDFQEMKRWITNIMSPKTVEDSPNYNEKTAKNLENLLVVMDEFQTMKDTLFERGIPIRNVEHYKQATGQTDRQTEIPRQMLGNEFKE